MTRAVFTTLLLSGLGVSFFHAAIPTHWLPFVLMSRLRHWSHGKTLAITAIAGTAHVTATAVLGVAITGFGSALNKTIGGWFPDIAGGILFALGLFYLIRRPRGHLHLGHGKGHHDHDHGSGNHYHHPHLPERDHSHSHDHGGQGTAEQDHSHEELAAHAPSDRAAVGSLLAFLTVSPCEGFLPFYVSGIRYGWIGFALLTAILSVGAILGMLLFTWLTLTGLAQVRMAVLEKYESVVMGILLCAVGLLILFLEY